MEELKPILPKDSDSRGEESLSPSEERERVITEQSIVKYLEDFRGERTMIVATFGNTVHWEKAVKQLEETVKGIEGFLTEEEGSKDIEFCVFPLREPISKALIGLKEGENVTISVGGACDCEILKILQPEDY